MFFIFLLFLLIYRKCSLCRINENLTVCSVYYYRVTVIYLVKYSLYTKYCGNFKRSCKNRSMCCITAFFSNNTCNMCCIHRSCHRWFNLIRYNDSIIRQISQVKCFRSLQYLYHSLLHILNISNTLLHIRIVQ